jgi:hypothetical protein
MDAQKSKNKSNKTAAPISNAGVAKDPLAVPDFTLATLLCLAAAFDPSSAVCAFFQGLSSAPDIEAFAFCASNTSEATAVALERFEDCELLHPAPTHSTGIFILCSNDTTSPLLEKESTSDEEQSPRS